MGNRILVQTHNYELTSRLSTLDLLHAFSTNLIIFLFSTFYVRERERESIIEGGNCDKHATFDAPLATIATFFLTNATSPQTFAT